MLTLKAQKRDIKIKPKALRKQGKMPAVFYGRKEESTSIEVSYADFFKLWKVAGESSVIELTNLGKELNVLIYDVQFDPVRGEPIHADFYVVETDREVTVSVPLEFAETAPAEKLGGIIVKVLHEIEIEGLPKDLPQSIDVDLSSLSTLESKIIVGDLVRSSGIKILTDKEKIVALVSEQKEEVVEEKTFDATEVEVEKKGKQEEEGSEEEKKEV